MHFSVPGSRRCIVARRAGRRAGHEFDDVFPRFAAFLGAELVRQHRQDRSVKFFRLRHTHLVDFEADDVEPGAREHFDHAAGPAVGKFEIVGLDQDERFLNFGVGRIGNDIVEHPAVAVGKFGPELEIIFDRLGVERGEHAGSK